MLRVTPWLGQQPLLSCGPQPGVCAVIFPLRFLSRNARQTKQKSDYSQSKTTLYIILSGLILNILHVSPWDGLRYKYSIYIMTELQLWVCLLADRCVQMRVCKHCCDIILDLRLILRNIPKATDFFCVQIHVHVASSKPSGGQENS